MITWKTVPEWFHEEEIAAGKTIKRCWDNPQGYVYFFDAKPILRLYLFPEAGEYAIFWRIKRSVRKFKKPFLPRARTPLCGHYVLPSFLHRRYFYLQEKIGIFHHDFLARAFYESCTMRPSNASAISLIAQAEKYLAAFRSRK